MSNVGNWRKRRNKTLSIELPSDPENELDMQIRPIAFKDFLAQEHPPKVEVIVNLMIQELFKLEKENATPEEIDEAISAMMLSGGSKRLYQNRLMSERFAMQVVVSPKIVSGKLDPSSDDIHITELDGDDLDAIFKRGMAVETVKGFPENDREKAKPD